MGGVDLRKERVGFAMCGSFCTHSTVLEALDRLTREYETVIPIVSEISGETDTRFGTAESLLGRLEELTGRKPLQGIAAVEPIGPKELLDVLVIAPATGNTVAKLAAGITDTTVTMAAKAHLRNGRPVVLALVYSVVKSPPRWNARASGMLRNLVPSSSSGCSILWA